jgi:protein-disulfide isomerase
MSKEAKILTAILVLVVGGMIAIFAFAGDSPSSSAKIDASKLVLDSSYKQGTGQVTMVEFGDYQCPACGGAYPIIKQLQQEYQGKLTLVFRNFPLPMHQNAMIGAEAAEAAGAQGKYWEMHDKLYETQNIWGESTAPLDLFTGYAQELGLDVNKFKQDVSSNAYQSRIDKDKSDGEALNVNATPTIYINGEKAATFDHDALKKMIDKALGQ